MARKKQASRYLTESEKYALGAAYGPNWASMKDPQLKAALGQINSAPKYKLINPRSKKYGGK